MELPGEDATIRNDNGKLIIEAAAKTSLLEALRRLPPPEEHLDEFIDLPAEPVDL